MALNDDSTSSSPSTLADHANVSVSVVIPVFNEAATIEGCLHALLRQRIPPLEVLVVDNRCTDDTVERTRRFAHAGLPIRIVRQSAVQGLIATRDEGFDSARGDVLARIDADTVIDEDWIEQLRTAFTDPGLAATSGPVRYYDFPLITSVAMLDNGMRRAALALSRRNKFLFGANMAIRRNAWDAIRSSVCTDREDLLHEDIDLAIHLVEHQLHVGYTPTLTAQISARRLNCSRAAFSDYTRRLDRTFAAHGLTHRPLQLTGTALRYAFPALRSLHARASATLEPLTPRVGS